MKGGVAEPQLSNKNVIYSQRISACSKSSGFDSIVKSSARINSVLIHGRHPLVKAEQRSWGAAPALSHLDKQPDGSSQRGFSAAAA